jgi:hypothetical protein
MLASSSVRKATNISEMKVREEDRFFCDNCRDNHALAEGVDFGDRKCHRSQA